MARHWFVNSLVLSTLMATATPAQMYSGQSPADQSVSQFRTSRPRDGIDPAAARARHVVAPAPVQLVDDSENSGRSFLPKWLDWRRNKPAEPTNAQPTPKRQPVRRPTGQVPSVEPETTPPDPAAVRNLSLPGLGGSPLPRSGRPTSDDVTAGAGDATTTSSRPSLPPTKPSTSSSAAPLPGISSLRTAAREPAGSAAPTPDGRSTTSKTRNSPLHRTVPNISPDELRRELSGTFPAASTGGNDSADATTVGRTATQTTTSEGTEHNEPITEPETTTTTPPTLPAMKPTKTTAPTTSSTNGNTSRTSPDVTSSRRSRSAYNKSNTAQASPTHTNTPQTTRGKQAFGEVTPPAATNDPNVLASTQTPVLSVDIRGPKQILVGREALYRVRLQNQSNVPAEGIVATVRIPNGAEVMNTTATQGAVQPAQDGQSAGLQWHLDRLDRRVGETLEIRLIPRESRPLELGVTWTLAPVGSRAIVEVQEAKLSLEVTGPNEVLFDKPQTFKLTLTNPGTGPAENIKIDLMPPGGGQEAVSSHPLGVLAAGASQTVEVELTAREAGKLFVRAVATADGGLASESAKEIFCRKPELEVDWRGPATKYAGTMATYFLRVRNPGTAPAEDVTVRASLPEGAEFTSASEGQAYDGAHREVAWHVGTLAPGDDNYMELKCVLKSAGKNSVKISAANAAGDLAHTITAETNVVAIADLKLEVIDPSGPVAVGSPAVYEIHIRNRGANAAKDVNVVALFSQGIEPEQAEGAMYSVSDGRVSFKPIEDLPAGREVVLRIRAHAVQAGTHVFRAEVLCRDLDIKLAAEETTRFYADDTPPSQADANDDSVSRSAPFAPKLK